MLTVFFSAREFVLIDLMSQGQKSNSKYMCDNVLSKIECNFAKMRGKTKSEGTFLHMDNAKPHNPQRTKAYIEYIGMKRVPHPAYSSDISPSDYWLFGFLKRNLKEHHIKMKMNSNKRFLIFYKKYQKVIF